MTFGVTIVREIDDNDRLSADELRSLQIASITKCRDQVLRGLGSRHSKTHAVRLRRIRVVRDHTCCQHRGSYELESPSSGLILLRWTLPATSWCACANMATIEYNVEVVSKDATILTTLGKVRNDTSKKKKKSTMQPTQSDCGVHFQVSTPRMSARSLDDRWEFDLNDLSDLEGFDFDSFHILVMSSTPLASPLSLLLALIPSHKLTKATK